MGDFSDFPNCYTRQGPGRTLLLFIPFPPESDATASGPQSKGPLYTRAVYPGGSATGVGVTWAWGPPPLHPPQRDLRLAF